MAMMRCLTSPCIESVSSPITMVRSLGTLLTGAFALLVLSTVLVTSDAGVTINNGNYINNGGEGNGINFIISTYTRRGQCRLVVVVVGEDFDDKFSEPCNSVGSVPSKLIMSGATIVGELDKDPFVIYTNSTSPKELVLIRNNNCTKKVYNTEDEHSEEEEMNDSECEKVKKHISDKIEENRRYWEQWRQNFDQQMAQAFNKPPFVPEEPSAPDARENYSQPDAPATYSPPAVPAYSPPADPAYSPPAAPAYTPPASFPPIMPILILPPFPPFVFNGRAYENTVNNWQREASKRVKEFEVKVAEYERAMEQLHNY